MQASNIEITIKEENVPQGTQIIKNKIKEGK